MIFYNFIFLRKNLYNYTNTIVGGCDTGANNLMKIMPRWTRYRNKGRIIHRSNYAKGNNMTHIHTMSDAGAFHYGVFSDITSK